MQLVVNGRPRHWWAFLIRGILFILVGVYLLSSPANSFAALACLFGVIILLTGLFELFRLIIDRDHSLRGWHLLRGIIDVIIGIVLAGHTGASETILRIIVGLWFLFSGLTVLSFSSLTGRSWVLTLGGALIVLFAVLIIFNPLFGAVTIVLWTAFAFIITGIFNVLLGFRLK